MFQNLKAFYEITTAKSEIAVKNLINKTKENMTESFDYKVIEDIK